MDRPEEAHRLEEADKPEEADRPEEVDKPQEETTPQQADWLGTHPTRHRGGTSPEWPSTVLALPATGSGLA